MNSSLLVNSKFGLLITHRKDNENKPTEANFKSPEYNKVLDYMVETRDILSVLGLGKQAYRHDISYCLSCFYQSC